MVMIMKITSIILILFVAIGAQGAYLTNDYEGQEIQIEKRPFSPPPRYYPEPPDNPFYKYLDDVYIGHPEHFEHMEIYPLYLNNPDTFPYYSMDQAGSKIRVSEIESWGIEKVRITNKSNNYVFIAGGQLITGGRQNRLLSEDILIGPHSEIAVSDVYCIEELRSTGTKDYFEFSPYMGGRSMRNSANSKATQQTIWNTVNKTSERYEAKSPTKDYHMVFDTPELKKQYDKYYHGISRRHFRKSVGMVVAWKGQIIGAELFSNPDLFRQYYKKLLYSYLVDCPKEFHHNKMRPVTTQHTVQEWLESGLNAKLTDEYTPGEGTKWHIEGARYSGTVLIHRKKLTHVTLYPKKLFLHDERRYK